MVRKGYRTVKAELQCCSLKSQKFASFTKQVQSEISPCESNKIRVNVTAIKT